MVPERHVQPAKEEDCPARVALPERHASNNIGGHITEAKPKYLKVNPRSSAIMPLSSPGTSDAPDARTRSGRTYKIRTHPRNAGFPDVLLLYQDLPGVVILGNINTMKFNTKF